jgi:septal ring factor EnvC (AmiA/AmiB activator)
LLLWDMEREFTIRAWHQDEQLRQLGAELAKTTTNFASVDAAVDGIPETILEFDSRIALLKPKLGQMKRKLKLAQERHAEYLQGLAYTEMLDQRERLKTYRAQARFALASLYDRMSAKAE